MNLNQEYYKQCEIFSQKKGFTSGQIFNKFHNVVAKSTAEPENSNYLLMANITSTPLIRAFFVRSTRTPKEYPELHESREYQFTPNEFNQLNFERVKSLSMVACNGKGFALCCVPLVAVSQPVTRYRPKPENFQAVTSSNLLMEFQKCYFLPLSKNLPKPLKALFQRLLLLCVMAKSRRLSLSLSQQLKGAKMRNQQEQFNKGILKCWQAATLLDAMSKSRLQDMDGVDISIAIEGIHGILHSALCEMEDLEFTGGKND